MHAYIFPGQGSQFEGMGRDLYETHPLAKQLFDEAGVPYPNPNWNHAEFLETAKALTKNGKHGFVFTTWMPGWIMWLWNSGGDVFELGDGDDMDEVRESSSPSP